MEKVCVENVCGSPPQEMVPNFCPLPLLHFFLCIPYVHVRAHSLVLPSYYSLIGTPPRIDGRTIKYTFLEKQFGDSPPTPFSFLHLQKGVQVK